MDKNVTKLKFGNSKEHEVRKIWDSAVYAKKLEAKSPLRLYYLIVWKSYPKEKNTWKPILVVKHLWKPINSVHKNNLDISTATYLLVNSTLLTARTIFRPRNKSIKATKRKLGWFYINSANKCLKSSEKTEFWVLVFTRFLSIFFRNSY